MIIEAEFSPGMTLAECEEVARLAEEAGFDRLGVSDVVLWPDTFVVQALCARATSRVQIGAMVTNPYSRHPAVTAAAVAALDELSGGRAFLGLGVGAGLEEVGIGYPAPVTTLCRRGWASRSASCGATVPARRPVLTNLGDVAAYLGWHAVEPISQRRRGRVAGVHQAGGYRLPQRVTDPAPVGRHVAAGGRNHRRRHGRERAPRRGSSG